MSIIINGSTFTGNVGSDGTYQVALQGIPDGTYDYTVTIEDEAGNIAGYIVNGDATLNTNATKQITIDRVVPETSDPEFSDDTDISGNNVYDLTPTIQGQLTTEIANLYLTFEIAGGEETTLDITSFINNDLSWSYTFDALVSGNFIGYEVSLTGLNGEYFEVEGFFKVRAPLENNGLSDSSNSGSVEDELTNDNTPTFEGTGHKGESVTLNIDGQTYSATVDNSGNWSIDVTLALGEGTHTYEVKTEISGNTVSTQSGTVEIDTSSPSANWRVTDTDNDKMPEFTGISPVLANSQVVITFEDGNGDAETVTTTADGSGQWTAEMGEEHNAGAIYDITIVDNDSNTETHDGIIL